jgi:ABC-type antimicrobial peptide transport system permease subunit
VITLDQVTRGQEDFFAFWTTLLLAGGAMALVLSLGSIFAVMAFTVARRTREIGVRVALGASRTAVVLAIFRRPLLQIALGVAGGGLLLAALLSGLGEGLPDLSTLAVLAGYMTMVAAVCLLACIVPTARALAIQPSDALRIE